MLRRTALSLLILAIIFSSPVLFAAEVTRTAPPAAKKISHERRTPAVRVYTSLNPADGSMINNAKPTIAAEYVDEGIGINPAETKVYLDGMDVSTQVQSTPNKVSYIPPQPLADGPHKVRIDIEDKAGNPASVAWTFTLRTKPPTVKITSHKPNQYVNKTPILVTGTVDNTQARVVVNGVTAATERGAFSAKINIVEGNNTVTAVAADPFGNTASDSVVVILDSKPPTVEITTPIANSMLNTKTVRVAGIVDTKAATVVVSGQTGTRPTQAAVANGTFSATDVALVEGVNTITAKAVSSAGNVGTSSIRITVDTVPPRIAITSPKDQTMTNKKMITVTGTVDDPTAMIKVNNTPVQISRGVWTLSGVNLAEGPNSITATAVDRAGNQASAASVVVVLKTVPPAPPRLGDLPFVTRSPQVTVLGTAEPGARIELYMNSVSKGSQKADEKGAFEFKTALVEGNNAFSAIATDAVGNVSASSAVVNVFLDTKPPRIL